MLIHRLDYLSTPKSSREKVYYLCDMDSSSAPIRNDSSSKANPVILISTLEDRTLTTALIPPQGDDELADNNSSSEDFVQCSDDSNTSEENDTHITATASTKNAQNDALIDPDDLLDILPAAIATHVETQFKYVYRKNLEKVMHAERELSVLKEHQLKKTFPLSLNNILPEKFQHLFKYPHDYLESPVFKMLSKEWREEMESFPAIHLDYMIQSTISLVNFEKEKLNSFKIDEFQVLLRNFLLAFKEVKFSEKTLMKYDEKLQVFFEEMKNLTHDKVSSKIAQEEKDKRDFLLSMQRKELEKKETEQKAIALDRANQIKNLFHTKGVAVLSKLIPPGSASSPNVLPLTTEASSTSSVTTSNVVATPQFSRNQQIPPKPSETYRRNPPANAKRPFRTGNYADEYSSPAPKRHFDYRGAQRQNQQGRYY